MKGFAWQLVQVLIMLITLHAGRFTDVDPGTHTTLAGRNNLITVVEHNLLGFRGLVILLYIVFHSNTLQYIGLNYL